jgi:single-strand DNA-binding protein
MPIDDLNQVTIIGRLSAKPELSHTGGGTAFARFNVASNRSWKDRDGTRRDAVQWTRVVVWGKRAESAVGYLVKGQRVLISGRLETSSWEVDGERKYKTEVVALHLQFLDKPRGSDGRRDAPSPPPTEDVTDGMYDDTDVPF